MKSNKRRVRSFNFIFSISRLVTFILLASFLLISLAYSSQIETLINVGYSTSNAVLDESGLVVHFVDVGQGDAILIEFPDDKSMIIDAGPSGNAQKLIDYINNNIFENVDMPIFDYMLLTHSDTDHIGASDEILEEYQVNNIYRPEIYASYNNIEDVPAGKAEVDTQTYAKVIDYVLNEPNSNIFFSFEGMKITGGSLDNAYSLTFLSPMRSYYTDVNEFSPILLLEYKNKKIMLTGDATINNEEDVLEAYDLNKIDILKLGHHGSSTSTSSELLSETNLTYAVISVGQDNRYNHPNQNVINRLIYSGVQENNILRTDKDGSIIANINIEGQLNMFTQVESLPTYIEWEFVVLALLIINFDLCFGKKTI